VSFTINADLPLGTYRGAGNDGRPESLPSVARLHAALLCAAGFGPRAVSTGEDLNPCEADAAALRWMEEHPPDAVVIPQLQVNLGSTVAYRDDGTIKQARGRGTTKKLAKTAGVSVAVAGRFEWTWHTEPPTPVREALTALCGDVPYLGTTEVPVRLTTIGRSAESTHVLDRQARPFTRTNGDIDIDACLPGRTAELAQAHARRRVAPRGGSRAGYGTDEWSLSDVPPREAVEPVRYRSREAEPINVPWGQVILLPLSRKVDVPYRVAWAVAAHRALIKLLDEDSPPLLTGIYPPGSPRPVNRLALQLLDPAMPTEREVSAESILAVMIPTDAAEAEVELIAEAVKRLPSVRGPRGWLAKVSGRGTVASGATFWRQPEPGQVRLWRTVPAAVPDTRGDRAQQWTFIQAALLSVGFVWKDVLPRVPGRREEYYRNLARAVTDAGVAVVSAKPLRTVEVGRYAHRVNQHAVVRPYEACLWLGDLAPSTAVTAIGQSRHLGGGLLVPHDVPEGTALADVDKLPAKDCG
jgi:CRISPR-associated protein Csb2